MSFSQSTRDVFDPLGANGAGARARGARRGAGDRNKSIRIDSTSRFEGALGDEQFGLKVVNSKTGGRVYGPTLENWVGGSCYSLREYIYIGPGSIVAPAQEEDLEKES